MDRAKERSHLTSTTASAFRLAKDAAEVGASSDTEATARRLKEATSPPSPSKALKKAGVALIVAPDPFTGVGGVALLASAYVVKRRQPASVSTLAEEARRVLREFDSLSV